MKNGIRNTIRLGTSQKFQILLKDGDPISLCYITDFPLLPQKKSDIYDTEILYLHLTQHISFELVLQWQKFRNNKDIFQ